MSYATEAYAVEIYGNDYVTVSTDKAGAGVIGTALFAKALSRATSLINGKLAGRVPLPLDPVPEDIQGYCVDIAIYFSSVTCDVMTDGKKDLYTQAVKALDMMAKNATSLGLEDPPLNISANAEYASQDRVFDRSSLDKIL